jgi:single-stranded DNA-specific DHH superfamily exonuclease
MTHLYAFNGDADGLCALQQLRLVDPRDATLVTGVKRDITLLRRVSAAAGDEVTVLDISLDANRDDLNRLLEAGASVRYFDHHHAGELPRHANFEPHIEEAADVCTSTLVDRHLAGRHRSWAIVAAFGDNLPELGAAMATAAGIAPSTTAVLERLGISLNYNAYGSTISDLCFDPADLAQQMLPFADPMEFTRHSPAHARLTERYEEDMQRARALKPARQVAGATVVVLPDEAWARRVIGVLANDLSRSQPDCAIAILAPKAEGGFTVSVRVPAGGRVTADEFCRGFETGGGRKLAAGINHLPAANVGHLAATFEARFRTP